MMSALMLRSLLLVAVTASATDSLAGQKAICPKHFDLRSLEAVDPQAVCADFSPSKYYYAKGDPTKFVLMLQGGGDCEDPQTCLMQLQNQKFRVSSKFLKTSMRASGIFDECHSSVGGFTAVYTHYCSLDNYLGDKELSFDEVKDSGAPPNTRMAFRGQRQVRGMLQVLVQEGMGSGEGHTLVLAGFDAGAKGAAVWLNEVQDLISNTPYKIEVVGLINGEPGMREDESIRAQKQAHLMGTNDLFGEECRGKMGEELESLCATARYKLKFTQPRYILAAPLMDRYQCKLTFGSRCESGDADPLAGKKTQFLLTWSKNMKNFLEMHPKQSKSLCAVSYGYHCDENSLIMEPSFWKVTASTANNNADLTLNDVLAQTLGLRQTTGGTPQATCAISQPIVDQCNGHDCGCKNICTKDKDGNCVHRRSARLSQKASKTV